MLLEPQELHLLFRLHRTLMFFVNQRLQVIPDVASPEEFSHLSPELRAKVRDAWLANIDLGAIPKLRRTALRPRHQGK